MVKKLILTLTLFLTSTASIVMTSPKQVAAANIDDMPRQEALQCLAENIYFESRNESLAGQLAVGMVVLNRVNDARFPSDICGVVFQGKNGTKENTKIDKVRKGRCQFSWTCDGLPDKVFNKIEWDRAVATAKIVYRMHKDGYDITEGATHYHANYVNPKWSTDNRMRRVLKVDRHIFYRLES